MIIKLDELNDGAVVELLEQHLIDMYAISPPESVHALNIDELNQPALTFYSCWQQESILGCAAIKELTPTHAELKSMRTAKQTRNLGVGSALLFHIINEAKTRGYTRLSLETGTTEFFNAAHRLYMKFGFQPCKPFAHYQPDPNSRFMSLTL